MRINGEEVTPTIVRHDPTDFSEVTARPEFVFKGKKFHDATGQLREGTLTSCGSVYVRFSAYADGRDFTEKLSAGAEYIGFAVAQVAPSSKESYTWERIVEYLHIEQQEKHVDIAENGDTEVLPDDGCLLSKVTIKTNVETGAVLPTLFAPAIEAQDYNGLENGMVEASIGKDNGGFVESVELRVDGAVVDNPFIFPRMGTYKVKATARAAKFNDGIAEKSITVTAL